MGNRQGVSQSPEFTSACRRFTESELRDLKALFLSLAAQSRSSGKFIVASVFQAYYGIHGSLGARLFDILTHRRKEQCLCYEDLVIAKSVYEKGSPDEIESFVYQLMDVLGDGLVQRSEVESVVLSTLETVLGPIEALPGGSLPEASLQGFLNAVEFSLKTDGEPCMTLDDFRHWWTLVPSFKKFLCSLLTYPAEGIMGRHVPQLRMLENGNYSPLLRKEFAWHIAGVLQLQEAREWVLLYNSSLHGFSFNTFLGNLSAAGGSSVFLIKDKEGCVYGGYATQPWERHSDFYGDMKSFLFSLYPRTAIYRPSGSNSNLQWCAINFTSESIPNGIGFGGQKNHFAIFLSGSFDHGHTFQSVTYNNPCFSSRTDIIPDVIECWGVAVEGDDNGFKGPSLSHGTVLERFKEDRHMLNMVGIANASDSVG